MLKVRLNRFEMFTPPEEAKLKAVIPLLERAVNSDEFREWCKSYKFESNKSYTMGMSSGEIYECIMRGNEILSKDDDTEMDIDLTIYSVPWYKSGKNVVGYTYPSTLKTWINRKFFAMFSLDGIAGNIMHEWMHKLGFGHSFSWTSTRDRSVPYACGYKIRDIVAGYLK